MKQKRLWILSGIPGSGKSTWVQKKVEDSGKVWISRDKIRFAILEDGEDYFAHEDIVIERFISDIQIGLDLVGEVFADATHLSRASRKSLLAQLNLKNVEVNCIYFDVPVITAIERNEQRTGRAHVPVSVIRRMFNQQTPPSFNEGFEHIIYIDEYGKEREVERNE